MRVKSFTFTLFLLLAAFAAEAQFTCTTNNGAVVITGYSGPGGTVTIPTNLNGLPVTAIGDEAFYERNDITSLSIPDAVTNIGDYAFYNCANLASLTLPASLNTIGDYSFAGCSRFTSLVLPSGVISLGTETFGSCSRLGSVSLSSSLACIGLNEFWECSSLTNVTIPNSITAIGEYAFAYCPGLTNITLPSSVTNLGYGAFWKCTGLAGVTIPGSVNSIGDYAFYNCTSLTSVHFNGPPPQADQTAFASDRATAYYMAGATGWGSSYGGIQTAPTVLPYPVILANDPSFGFQNNQFGFTVSWATNVPVLVETCRDFNLYGWTARSTNILTNGSFYYSDVNSSNFPARFYRVTAVVP